MYPRSMRDSDCVVIMGSNMAENHPVAFRWPMAAKVEHGAKLIHVDPRFTRTSAVADIYAPVRAGSDVAFLGGLVNYVINSERWNKDPFFRTWAVHYTNAATLINPDFQDTEQNDGVFSGLMEYKGGVPEWPYNGFTAQYQDATWQYAGTKVGDQGRVAATAQSGETPGTKSGTQQQSGPSGPPFDKLVQSLLKAAAGARRDAPEPDVRLSDRQAALQPVHTRNGGTHDRVSARHLRADRGNDPGQFRRRSHHLVRICGRLDTAHERSADHRLLCAAAVAAGELRTAGRGDHGPPRTRVDPGID
jgi:hypothetical protein